MHSMSHRKFTSLTPEERQQVIDGILVKLTPNIEQVVNEFLATIKPNVEAITRNEIGKFAVTEKQAKAFIDGMIRDAAEKASAYFRPRWIMKALFRART